MPLKKSLAAPATIGTPGMFTNLGGQPVAPAPIQAPPVTPSPAPPPFTFTPPNLGAAPTPTPFGAFTAPPPTLSAAGQFRIAQANKGAERSAAARGTLLSGGFQTALAKLNQGLASEEYGNDFNRSLAAYGANRDTNQQNFGQSLAGYGAGLDAGRLNLAGATAGYDRAYGASRDAYGDATAAAQQQTGVINANAQAQQIAAQQMADYNAALEAQRQAETARQNAETARMTGTMPVRRPMAGMTRRLG